MNCSGADGAGSCSVLASANRKSAYHTGLSCSLVSILPNGQKGDEEDGAGSGAREGSLGVESVEHRGW